MTDIFVTRSFLLKFIYLIAVSPTFMQKKKHNSDFLYVLFLLFALINDQ